MKEKRKLNITWKTCLTLAVCAFLVFLAIYYWESVSGFVSKIFSASAPLIVGFIIAYILNILMSFYERHYFKKRMHKKFFIKTRRPVCLVAAIITLLAFVTLIVWLVVPQFTACIKFLMTDLHLGIGELLENEWVIDILPEETLYDLNNIDWYNLTETVMGYLDLDSSNMLGTLASAVTSVVSGVITGFISILFTVHFLVGKERLKKGCGRLARNYIRPARAEKLRHYVAVLNECFHKYIVGQCIEAVILGVLCFVGMLIFGFPYPGMISALIAFTALVPIAGAYIGGGVGALMILTESPIQALLFILYIVVLQQLEGNLIYPKVVGDSVGLPSVWTLAAVIVGGGLAGIWGILVGVPIAATIYKLVHENMDKKELAKKEAEASEQPGQTASEPKEQ